MRREELAANLAAVEARLVAACAAAGRPRDEVTLVAVTKTFPASDVALLAELGVTDVAENRDQEAKAKAAACTPELAPECAALRWHFVGQLQRNKARSVVRYADVVHSLDRLELVEVLSAESQKRRDTPLDVLDSGEPRHGDSGHSSHTSHTGHRTRSRHAGWRSARRVGRDRRSGGDRAGLRLRGVMAVAPRGGEPDRAFARLAEVSAELQGTYRDAVWISAGMSGDLESAIRHGATHVRVGSALLGKRWLVHGTVAG